MKNNAAHLFQPLTVKSITLRNRIGVSPMCEYSAQDGLMNDWHLVHLGARAVGGAGLIVAEATAVSPDGRITPGCTGIWDDKHIEPIARVTRFIKQHGAVAGMQIAHAGRKASSALPWEGGAHLADNAGGWPVVAPSAIAFGGEQNKLPHALTEAEIAQVQKNFTAAARRALAAGIEWLELHFAHGYLAHEFLSPLSNQRTDKYGGSFENRIRFAVEIVRAVRAVWPDKLPLTARISATDWTEGGWNPDESVELCRRFKSEGIDLIDCSTGGNVLGAKIPSAPGYQVPFSERIRREADILTATVGQISEPTHAEEIIRNGRADVVLLAREFLREPYWPLRAANVLRQKTALAIPVQYQRAW